MTINSHPYIPGGKLEPALENNLLPYRVFERKSVVGRLRLDDYPE